MALCALQIMKEGKDLTIVTFSRQVLALSLLLLRYVPSCAARAIPHESCAGGPLTPPLP